MCERNLCWLVPSLGGKCSSLALSWMIAQKPFIDALCQVEKDFITSLHWSCWIFQMFSLSLMRCSLFFLQNMINYIDYFFHVKPILYYQNKFDCFFESNLLYFCILLDLVWPYIFWGIFPLSSCEIFGQWFSFVLIVLITRVTSLFKIH